jgi:hypothetical protein
MTGFGHKQYFFFHFFLQMIFKILIDSRSLLYFDYFKETKYTPINIILIDQLI